MMGRLWQCRRRGSLFLAIAVALCLLAVLPGGVAAQATPVGECRTIDDAGRYALTGNLSGNDSGPCVRIEASDVVLDGRGNAVVGAEGNGTGVLVEPAEGERLANVTVSNLTTTDWRTGLAYRGGVSSGTVRDVTAAANRDGIAIDPGSRSEDAAGTVSLVETRAVGNDRWGVALRPGADGDRLVDTELRNNAIGLVAVDVRTLSLADTVAANNSWGVVLGDATATTLRNTTVRANDRDGLRAGNGFDDGRLFDTTARENGGTGLRLGPAANVTLRNATAVDNGESGLVVRDASGIRGSGLTVTGNDAWGVEFEGVADGLLTDVTTDENDAGFYTATGSENVTIRSV